jgi:argininosuccinate lyase
MWHGRFSDEPSARLRAFSESVSFDQRLAAVDLQGSMAHARGLQRAGFLSLEELKSILSGLEAIAGEIERGEFVFREELEDVHMNIEAELTRRIGAPGAKLHTARSRNDQVATDLRLYLREAVGQVQAALTALQSALVGLGERNSDLLIPGYTHLQRAQPVYVAHHLLAYVEMLARDSGRLQDAKERFNICPLGSGALAGSTLALDREAVAKELGFSGVSHNSLDAVGDRDFVCEVLAALAILGQHLSRLCEDVILWNSSEFGFIRLSDAHTTGSSLMPQKKNPDIAELVRGKTGRLTGNLVSLLVTAKGLPLAYNRDLQEDKEPVFDSLDTARASVLLLAEMFEAAEFCPMACAKAVADPLLLATDVADLLVLRGVPFRQAHEQVGQLVARSLELSCPLNELPSEVLSEIAPLAEEGFAGLFDLSQAMAKRTAIGAPSLENVGRELARWRKLLGDAVGLTEK